jgi:hypothetical protein
MTTGPGSHYNKDNKNKKDNKDNKDRDIRTGTGIAILRVQKKSKKSLRKKSKRTCIAKSLKEV